MAGVRRLQAPSTIMFALMAACAPGRAALRRDTCRNPSAATTTTQDFTPQGWHLGYSPTTLTGVITDAVTHLPIRDAVVTAKTPTETGEGAALTNGFGRFVLPGMPPGLYMLTVEVEGFLPRWCVSIPVHESEMVRVDVDLSPDPKAPPPRFLR